MMSSCPSLPKLAIGLTVTALLWLVVVVFVFVNLWRDYPNDGINPNRMIGTNQIPPLTDAAVAWLRAPSNTRQSKVGVHPKKNIVTDVVRGGPPALDLPGPPMGFMSWERFRCNIDCDTFPDECIHERLYMAMADAMRDGGYLAAGYNRVDIDDCWAAMQRDPDTQRLVPDPLRFPSGMSALGDYLHQQGMLFGTYSDVGTNTCGGYPGSMGYEAIDAQTFADWGVDYLKLDGCYMDPRDYSAYYTKWGNALKQVAHQQPMAYSCSWPAYLGADETRKPFAEMYGVAGCNTWRNYGDIDNSWASLKSIMLHWADYWKPLRDSLPPGAFHDADMLLVGDDHYGGVQLSVEQARVQMGFWALITSPLFIGGDVRTIPDAYREILINRQIIAINQDPSRRMGSCLKGCVDALLEAGDLRYTSEMVQIWSKRLNGGKSIAYGFFNLDEVSASSLDVRERFSADKRLKQCLDLWAPGGTLMNLCPHVGTTSDEAKILKKNVGVLTDWKIHIEPQADGAFDLVIKAVEMPPMTHRMIRVDFLE